MIRISTGNITPTAIVLLLLGASLLCARPAVAAVAGSCDGFELDATSTLPLRSLRDGAPAYRDAWGSEVAETLELGQLLEVVELGDDRRRGRIAVQEPDERRVGWVERDELLCRKDPLKNAGGIERKLYIAPPPAPRGQPNTVKAYRDPQRSQCDRGCLELTRFQLYYVYAEDQANGSLLLSSRYDLADEDELTGWVRVEDGVQWDTAIGLRPRDEVDVTHIYRSPEDAARQSAERFPVIGNQDRRWYRYKQRMPVLELLEHRGKKVYKIAAPSVGAGIGSNPFDDQVDKVDLESLKNTDVFFLIDGTASMGPHIAAVREAVNAIVETLPGKRNFVESYFRFGFRIYRDDYADRSNPDCRGGVCEGLPLSHSTCEPSRDAMAANLREFDRRLGAVRASSNDADDYPEKLFGGLRQAVEDISSCPNNKKVLFVVGDHGDRERYTPPDLVAELKRFDKPLVMFFVQTPDRGIGGNYADAYWSFQNQSMDILDQVSPKEVYGKTVDPYSYYVPLSADLPDLVADKVEGFAASGDVNRITEALRGGQSLDDILGELMDEKVDLPVLYWEVIRQHACPGLGKQCSERIDHRVIEAYAPAGDDWREEVWMTGSDLAQWRSILNVFDKFGETMPATVVRRELVTTLANNLEDMVGKPAIRESGESIGDYIRARKTGLPINEDSPLMQYTLVDFFKMPVCELRQLNSWVTGVLKLMQEMLGSPTIRVSREVVYRAPMKCRMTHPVPRLERVRREALGPDDSYSYVHEFGDRKVFWFPRDFMP